MRRITCLYEKQWFQGLLLKMEPSVVETRHFVLRRRPKVVLQRELRLKHHKLVILGPVPAINSLALPRFDDKIWRRIAYFVPRMKGQPVWQAWTEYRTLNKIFKTEIEKYYVRHYLDQMSITIDPGEWGIDKINKVIYFGTYELDHLEGIDGRTAVFADKDVAEQFSKRYQSIMKVAMSLLHPDMEPDTDFNPNVMVKVRRELTDLLPMDLQCRFEDGDYCMEFNWRTYLCTYFDDQKRIAAANVSQDKVYETNAEVARQEIEKGNIDVFGALEFLMKQALLSLQRASDNAFRLVRRRRRARMGMKLHENLRGTQNEARRERYSKYGEDKVMRNMKDRRLYVSFEQFSDSESEHDNVEDKNLSSDAPRIWDTSDELEESDSEVKSIDNDSDDGRGGSNTTTLHRDVKKATSQEMVANARKHTRQQSSLGGVELQTAKRIRTTQSRPA